MKTVEVPLPDQVAHEVETLVQQGWFVNEAEVIRSALLEFSKHDRFKLSEEFQREDIAWASQKQGNSYG